MDDCRPIGQRLATLQERIAAAASRVGRRADSVTLVAVSKRQPLASLQAAFAAGQRIFGENLVQEAQAKIPLVSSDAEWHLIGPLQSNKVKLAARLFQVIHSVDRLKIAHLLSEAALAQGKSLRVFAQIQLGDEETKHGFDPATFAEEVRPLVQLPGLEWVGLMAIPPFFDDPEQVRPYFRQLRALRDLAASWPEWSAWPGYLSMGMSHDFEIAIEEGASHIRVGTAIFGERSPQL